MTIPIGHNTELYKFGLQGDKFRPLTHDRIGGIEWAGPCPMCGGTDRCVISNGYYWCRHSGVCGFKGKLEKLGDIIITDKERKEFARKAIVDQAEKAKDQKRKIKMINQARSWVVFHKTLLKFPELLLQLEKEGITETEIRKYQIGYTAAFSAYDYGINRFRSVPAFSFPHFKGKTCLNIRMRILDDEYIKEHGKYKPYKSNLPTLFFKAYDKNDRKFVVIVEGEKKAIVLKRFGIPAIGLWGIYAIKDAWVPWLRKRFEKRYLAYDTDNWGVIEANLAQAQRLNADPAFLAGKPDDLLLSGEVSPDEFLRRLGHDV